MILFRKPPTEKFMNQLEWKDLPKIPQGNTDVYFFGVPGCGKSCVLAGIIYQGLKDGKIFPHTEQTVGLRYFIELKNCIEMKYVAPPTNSTTVNYSSFTLHGKTNHNISVIEMAGEFFNRTHEKMIGYSIPTYDNETSLVENDLQKTNNGVDKTIGAFGYLKNDNRKSIFFVIEYYDLHHRSKYVIDQQVPDKVMTTLDLLRRDGTLNRTDSVQIIITKSDKMPDGVDRNEHAREFLTSDYLSFMNELTRCCKKFGINNARGCRPIVHPFSLGRVMLGKTFVFDPRDSIALVESLLHLTSSEREKPWYRFW